MRKILLTILATVFIASPVFAENVNTNLRAKNSDGNWVDLTVDASGNLKIALASGSTIPSPIITPIAPTVVTLTDGATVALDASLGNSFVLTAAGDRTISAPTNPTSGQVISIAHVASGADRTLTLTTGSAGAFRFGTDITALTATTSGTTDYLTCKYNATDDRWDVLAVVKGF